MRDFCRRLVGECWRVLREIFAADVRETFVREFCGKFLASEFCRRQFWKSLGRFSRLLQEVSAVDFGRILRDVFSGKFCRRLFEGGF